MVAVAVAVGVAQLVDRSGLHGADHLACPHCPRWFYNAGALGNHVASKHGGASKRAETRTTRVQLVRKLIELNAQVEALAREIERRELENLD